MTESKCRKDKQGSRGHRMLLPRMHNSGSRLLKIPIDESAGGMFFFFFFPWDYY